MKWGQSFVTALQERVNLPEEEWLKKGNSKMMCDNQNTCLRWDIGLLLAVENKVQQVLTSELY